MAEEKIAQQAPEEKNVPAQGEQTKQDSNSTGIWAWIGKIATVSGLVIGLITIYNYMNPRGPSIHAECASSEIASYIKHGKRSAEETIQSKLTIESLRSSMPYQAGASAKSNKILEELRDNISRNIFGVGIIDLKTFDLYRDNLHAFICKITNNGSERAEEVEMQFPSRLSKAFLEGRDLPLSNSSANSIMVGTIPAGPTINLEVWYGAYSPMRDGDKIFLNYRGGKGSVDIGQTYYGAAKKIANFVVIFFDKNFLIIIGFAITSMLLSGVVVSNKNKKK